MNYLRRGTAIRVTGIILTATMLLAACGTLPASTANPTATARPSVGRGITATPTESPAPTAARGVSASGVVMAAQDADLVFGAQGTVQEVLVHEGDVVTKGQVLARLDLRLFDQQLHQAEAALASARAQKAALSEAPRAYDAAAARAAVQSAQAALQQLATGATPQDVTTAQSAVKTAQLNLQSARDSLSQAKTMAEIQMQQAVESLTQAQARYAEAKANWNYVQETGRDPIQPDAADPTTGEKKPNKVTDGQANSYYNAFVQAEAAMRAAEQAVTAATASFGTARQQEVTGIQTTEQTVVQAQAALEKLGLSADDDRVAAARAQLAQARASQASLRAAPRASALAQADAGIAQAQAGLEQAQLNREYAALLAPFDGVVNVVNIDVGEGSTTNGQPAVRMVDISTLHIDAQISDIDIGKVVPGQQAVVYADALPGQQIVGTLRYIAPTATVAGNVRSYLVRITLNDTTRLRSGLSVRVVLAAPVELYPTIDRVQPRLQVNSAKHLEWPTRDSSLAGTRISA